MTSGSEEGWFLEYEERRIDLREGEITLGRSRGCGVVLRDPSVSRGHALLSVRQGRVTLQDLRSSNGTYVNGKRLDKETVVENGDRLVIGETELYLRRSHAGEGAQGSSGGRRIETGEASLICPDCGLPIHGSAGGRCPGCGAELSLGRLPRLSEASSLGEVWPVGEALGAVPQDSWDRTSHRRSRTSSTGSREIPTPVTTPRLPHEAAPPGTADPADPADVADVADAASTAETRQRDASGPPIPTALPASSLPMSVREAESLPPATRERSGAVSLTPVPPPPDPPPQTGLLSRLTGLFRGRKE